MEEQNLFARKPDKEYPFRNLGVDSALIKTIAADPKILKEFLIKYRRLLASLIHPDKVRAGPESESYKIEFTNVSSAIDDLINNKDSFYLEDSLRRLTSGDLLKEMDRKIQELKEKLVTDSATSTRKISTLTDLVEKQGREIKRSDGLFGRLRKIESDLIWRGDSSLIAPDSHYLVRFGCLWQYGTNSPGEEGEKVRSFYKELTDILSMTDDIDREMAARELVEREIRGAYRFSSSEDVRKDVESRRLGYMEVDGKKISILDIPDVKTKVKSETVEELKKKRRYKKKNFEAEKKVQPKISRGLTRERRDWLDVPGEVIGSISYSAVLAYMLKNKMKMDSLGKVFRADLHPNRGMSKLFDEFSFDTKHCASGLQRILPYTSQFIFPYTLLLIREDIYSRKKGNSGEVSYEYHPVVPVQIFDLNRAEAEAKSLSRNDPEKIIETDDIL